jgi:hypothetical protein
MIPLLVEYINALHSCLNTTTLFSLSHPPHARSFPHPTIKNHNQLAGKETHTLEESREDFAEYIDLMSSVVEPAPNVPPQRIAPMNYGNYNAMIASTEFSACGGLLGFNGSTHEGQPWYGQRP